MKIDATQSVDDIPANSVVLAPLFEGMDLTQVEGLTHALRERVTAAGGSGPSTRRYEVSFYPSDGQAPGVAFVGGGGFDDMEPVIETRLAATGVRYVVKRGYEDIACLIPGQVPEGYAGRIIAEAAVCGPYNPGIKKTGKDEEVRPAVQHLTIVHPGDGQAVLDGAGVGEIVGESIVMARDLVNTPANELTPSRFAEIAQGIAEERAIDCRVLDENDMRELGMGSFLGVAQGSEEPPRLIRLHLGLEEADVKLALCGKGLTFDSGGLSLKTAEGMETMKGDMGGGAAVLAGMAALARLGVGNVSVTAYIGATENMPGGHAMRPGDVLTAMNGETIEVLNTDAEGRLVLADLLCYAKQEGATHCVDFATLTGSAVVALGGDVTMAAGRPQEWVDRAVQAARAGLERAWPMPLYDSYRRAMDSDVADIKNSGTRWGGALNATAFLADFAKGMTWAHMDIAGPAWEDNGTPYRPVGGTGAGVGTIAALGQSLASEGGNRE